MNVLQKLGGQCNIINFSKYIDQNTNKNELKKVFNILKDDDKQKIIKKNTCLESYVNYMEKFEK